MQWGIWMRLLEEIHIAALSRRLSNESFSILILILICCLKRPLESKIRIAFYCDFLQSSFAKHLVTLIKPLSQKPK